MSDIENGNDGLAQLLRATGRRPAVPADRARRVEVASRAHFRAMARKRAWRKRGAWAALATAAALLILVALGLRPDAPSTVEHAGRVEVAAGASDVLGRELTVGAELATNAGERLSVRTASGHSLRIDAGTRARFVSAREIALVHGALYVDSRGPEGAARGPLEIRTGFGTLREVGTQYEARIVPSALRIRVREGAVAIDRRGGRLDVRAGSGVDVHEDGQATPLDPEVFAAGWEWVGDVAPRMEIEGRVLGEFLEWIGRERGWRLEYSTREFARTASTIRLHGSIAGMTLEQALETVLPACGVSHRLERGVLRLEPRVEGTRSL